MTNLKTFFIKIILTILVFSPSVSFSAPLFSPGETLDPGCLPTNPDCAVSTSSASLLYPTFTYASSTFSLLASSSQWTTNGTSIYYNGGNVGIGTVSPAFQLTQKSTASLESASLGTELTDATGWTTTTGWTGDYNTGFTHNKVGSITPLSRTITISASTLYQVTFTITNCTTGSFTVSLGGQNSNSSYSTNGIHGYAPQTLNSTGGLIFIPTTDFNGTISAISVKQITGPYSPTYAILDNTGTSSIEIRSSLNTLNNQFIGKGAGEYNTTGYSNTANGVSALNFNTTGYSNTANGMNALYSNTTGINNTANGAIALYFNTTGSNNTANGSQALYSNTTGYDNAANGTNALYSNTTGINNTANGTNALYSNTTGIYNTANGMNALYSNTTGINNTANGTNALYSNTTGNMNTANGMNALYSNTTGSINTANGALALLSNTTGYNNTANGSQALYSNTTGNYNTANGVWALYSNTIGNFNTAVGYTAGMSTSIGADNTTGSNSVFLGYDTMPLADGQTNQIVIGANAVGLGSNSVVLGDNNIITTALKGNVGIGTSTPSAKLDIYGTAGSADIFGVSSSSLARLFTIASNGSTTISSLTAGMVKSTSGGLLYTDSSTYLTSNQIADIGTYSDIKNPLLYWASWTNTPSVIKTVIVPGATDYGTWDGKNLWVGSFGNHTISKVSADDVILNTYTLASNIEPLQMAYDGRYIWVGSADTYGNLVKFDPVTGTTVATYIMNPSGLGAGGVQGTIWDGSNIWIGVAQAGAGTGSGFVAKLDSSGNILASTTGQSNVNGMAFTNVGGVESIWAACTGFLSKINASDMTYSTSTAGGTSYRIATDGQFIYDADFYGNVIRKYRVSDGVLVATWPSGSLLNTVAFDGKYVWTSGDDEKVTIHDRDTGAIVYTIPNGGRSDLIFDGTYMWSISRTNGSVRKISIGNVNANVKFNDSLSILSTGSTSTSVYLNASTTGSSYIMNKFGIGTTTPTASLTASGTIRFSSLGSASANLVTDSLGNVTVSSDERLKNITGDFTRGLSAIEGLTPINYHWNATSGMDMIDQYTGFSAQNVQANIPEAVATDSRGYLTLADRPIVAALVNAVKEIGSFITKVENGIAYLTNIVVERLTVGSNISPEGITMFDIVTNQPYCVSVSNGNLVSKPGDCSSGLSTSTPGMQSLSMGGSSTPNINSTSSTSSVDTLSSTTSSETSTTTSATSSSLVASSSPSTSSSFVTSSNSTATTTASSTPKDITPPVITIRGTNPISITTADTYTDEGATAKDDVDGVVPVVSTGTVDTTKAGTYTIEYSATDKAGNSATSSRVVNVTQYIPITVNLATSTATSTP